MNVDMHVHTMFSRDAGSDPDSILSAMRSKGIDAVVITDHDTNRFLDEYPDRRFIPGIELSTDVGHVLGFWFYGKYTSKRKIPFEEAVKLIHDSGGLAFLAHPFDWRRGFKQGRHILTHIVRNVDGIEVCNSKNKTNAANSAAKAFAKWHDLLMSAGSDAHFPNEIGKSYVHANTRSLSKFRSLFERGNISLYCSRQSLISQGISYLRSRLSSIQK